jgi:hypothetical protein
MVTARVTGHPDPFKVVRAQSVPDPVHLLKASFEPISVNQVRNGGQLPLHLLKGRPEAQFRRTSFGVRESDMTSQALLKTCTSALYKRSSTAHTLPIKRAFRWVFWRPRQERTVRPDGTTRPEYIGDSSDDAHTTPDDGRRRFGEAPTSYRQGDHLKHAFWPASQAQKAQATRKASAITGPSAR